MNKVMKPILIAIVGVALVAGAMIGLNHLEHYEEDFYVQIDNARISEVKNSSDMKYEYKLTGYNKEGQEKTLTFKTTRRLRDEAYLKLLVKAMGVNNWEEVQLDEMPEKARMHFSK